MPLPANNSGAIVMAQVLIGPITGKVLTTSGASSSTELTQGTKGVVLISRTSDAYFAVGDGDQEASAASGYLPVGVPVYVSTINMTTPAVAVINGPTGATANVHVLECQGFLR